MLNGSENISSQRNFNMYTINKSQNKIEFVGRSYSQFECSFDELKNYN